MTCGMRHAPLGKANDLERASKTCRHSFRRSIQARGLQARTACPTQRHATTASAAAVAPRAARTPCSGCPCGDSDPGKDMCSCCLPVRPRPQGLESHRLSPGLSCGNAVRLHRLGHVGLLHVRLDGPEPESLLSRMLLPTLLHTLATKSTRTTKAAALAAAGALGATGAAAAAIIAAELPDELRASKGCLSRVLVRHQRAHLVSA